jgi:nucleoside-diphosphate-sugar epimerase
MKLAITGASGYIGQRLTDLAIERGHEVVALTRHRPGRRDAGWLPFDLRDAGSARLPDDAQWLIHLAAVTHENEMGKVDELSAVRHLIAASASKVVFVSSQAAGADAPTAYGRTKWAIERIVLDGGGVVVRPGQVYGGQERALFWFRSSGRFLYCPRCCRRHAFSPFTSMTCAMRCSDVSKLRVFPADLFSGSAPLSRSRSRNF